MFSMFTFLLYSSMWKLKLPQKNPPGALRARLSETKKIHSDALWTDVHKSKEQTTVLIIIITIIRMKTNKNRQCEITNSLLTSFIIIPAGKLASELNRQPIDAHQPCGL